MLELNKLSAKSEEYLLRLSTKLYSIEAIKRVVYKFADRAAILLIPTDKPDFINLSIKRLSKSDESQALDILIDEIKSELLDQDLREIIKRETAPLRNVIFAHAFSRTKLVEQN